MKGFYELEQKRYELEEEIQKKQKQIKQLDKDKKMEMAQYNNAIFWIDKIELKYSERFNIYNNELQHLKDKLKLVNYCINTVFY
jgi:chromosome segregation ATPase